ncbi:MAG: aminoacyl-tRNA hydrolase [Clostridia bacterium]|nr:aminoacyl-tRNA hydrolase [Clostridia bacterium]
MCPFFAKVYGSLDFLAVGLGNPGSPYAATRHNVGFMAVDSLAAKLGVKIDRVRHNALTAKCEINGRKGMLLKPQTFMNNSGLSVADAARYYNVLPHEIIVMYDDVSLPVGALRVRKSGSAGGHNGVESIIEYLGSDGFPRIRFGIGSKPAGWELSDYVLGKLPPADKTEIEKRFGHIGDIIALILSDEAEKAMSLYNYNPPRSNEPEK